MRRQIANFKGAGLLAALVVLAGLIVMADRVPAHAREGGDINAEGFSATNALAECQLASSIFEDTSIKDGAIKEKMLLPVLVILETCVDELKPGPHQAHFLDFRGSVLARIGAQKRALYDFERATKLEPENIAYAISHGRALLVLEEGDLALGVFRPMLRLAPRNADVLAGLGASWFYAGDPGRAEAFLAQALAVNPDHGHALRDLGLVALYNGADRRAVEYFDKAITLEKENAALFLYRGIARHRTGDGASGLEDLNRAAALEPANTRVLVNRGSVLAGLERTGEAMTDFTAAIELDPGAAEAFYGRGLLGARLAGDDKDKWDRARSDLKQAMTLGPDNPLLEAAMAVLQPAKTDLPEKRY